mgnify:CR=1 FL=1|tara:strand:+ start:40 stop:363 length:324 start_codon:yes stop_codon:yes gene_type:complete
MTYPAPDKLPYDEWFDPNYKWEPHPYDSWPKATNKTPVERLHDDIRNAIGRISNKENTIHEKMYQIATSKYNPFAVGGSESIHDFDGGSEQIWAEDLPDLAPSEYEP